MTTTIAEKLQIKPHSTVWLSDPAQLTRLTPMPEGVRETDTLGTASTAVLFAGDTVQARELLAQHSPDLDKPGAVWVAFPKGGRTDISADALGPIAADFHLRPDDQIAIDDRWSALGLIADTDEQHDKWSA